jgi:uroporphyrinogen-III synthase
LNQQGHTTFLLPSIDIIQEPNHPTHLDTLKKLKQTNIAIFTSANAVTASLPRWPADTHPKTIIAIGPGTKQALEKFSITALTPNTFSSEGLLAMPELKTPAHQNIAIFQGTNPKPLLKNTLKARGANVHTAFCYHRARPNFDATLELPHLIKQNIDTIISTSTESLQNLHDMLGKQGHAWLTSRTLIVVSPAMQTLAAKLGFESCLLASNASDTAIANALSPASA